MMRVAMQLACDGYGTGSGKVYGIHMSILIE